MTINKHSLTQVSTREYIGLATKTISLEPLRRITKIPLALTIQEGQFYAYPVLRKRGWKKPVVVSEPDPSAPPETPVAPAPVKRDPSAPPETPVAPAPVKRAKKK
jgi:hypothetical protein